MELREYWAILARRWPIWIGLGLLSLVLSTLYALLGPSAYEATLRVAVGTEPLPSAVGYYDPNYYAWLSSEYLADDLSELLKSEAVAQDVSDLLGRRITPAALASVTRTKKTHRMLDVTVSAPTAQEALEIGRAYEQVINTRLPQYFPQLRVQNAHVSVINRPQVTRSLPLPLLAGEILLRALVGLVLGIGLAFLVDYLDASIRDRADAERSTGVPVLAEIPALR